MIRDVSNLRKTYTKNFLDERDLPDQPLNLFDKSVLIAPPNVSMSFIFDNPERPCDIVYGEKDTYIDPKKFPSHAKLRIKAVKDGDHFFYGSYGDLSAQLMSSLTEE